MTELPCVRCNTFHLEREGCAVKVLTYEEIGREFVRIAKDESSGIDELIELRNKARGLKE